MSESGTHPQAPSVVTHGHPDEVAPALIEGVAGVLGGHDG